MLFSGSSSGWWSSARSAVSFPWSVGFGGAARLAANGIRRRNGNRSQGPRPNQSRERFDKRRRIVQSGDHSVVRNPERARLLAMLDIDFVQRLHMVGDERNRDDQQVLPA